MSASAVLLLAVDAAIGAMKVAQAYNELIQGAAVEGRDITLADLAKIEASVQESRLKWDESVSRL